MHRTNSFSYIFNLSSETKGHFLWLQAHILPVNEGHLDALIKKFGTGTLSRTQ